MSRRPKPAPRSVDDVSSLDATIVDFQTTATPPAPLLWRFKTVVEVTTLSRRTIERLRSARQFPRPDVVVGKRVLWKPSTIEAWIEDQSARAKGGSSR